MMVVGPGGSVVCSTHVRRHRVEETELEATNRQLRELEAAVRKGNEPPSMMIGEGLIE